MKRVHLRVLLGVLALSVVVLMGLVAGCGTSTTSTSATEADAYDIDAILAGIETDAQLNAALPEAIQTNGVKVASDVPWPPWEMFVTEGGTEITGFDYDLAQALGAVLGVKFEFVQTGFDDTIPSLQSGRNDIVMSAMYDQLVRREIVDFVDYAWDGSSLLILKDNPEGLTDLNSLSGKKVACESGTTQATLLENTSEALVAAGKAPITINQYDDGPAAILALQSGNVVAYLTDNSVAVYTAQTTQDGGLFAVITDPTNEHGYNPQIDGIGVLKGNEQLRDAIKDALQKLIDSGVYTQIIDHYGLIPVDSAQINQGTDPGN